MLSLVVIVIVLMMPANRMHVRDFVTDPYLIKQCEHECKMIEDNDKSGGALVGGDIFKNLKKFFQGKTKLKPSTVLKGISKVLGYAKKYGQFVPGLSEFVPVVSGVAKIAADKGANYLEKRGKAMVGGQCPMCGSAMVGGAYYPSPFVRTGMHGGEVPRDVRNNYTMYKKNTAARIAGSKKNTWVQFVKDFRKKNPQLKGKEVMIQAAKKYKKKPRRIC